MEGERNTTFLNFPHDLVQSVCALHKHEEFALSQHVLWPYFSRNLDVARRIYNYTLTRARRMVECAFGTVCNKWRIFHCATDVCLDFRDVVVKTCCILYNFVRQRDCFQFQDTLYKCPLESIKAVGNRGNITGVEGSGDRNVYPLGSLARGYSTKNLCVEGPGDKASLSIGAPLGCMGGGGSPFTRNSER
jgi:hypothetical protein